MKQLRNTNLRPIWFIIVMNRELPQYSVPKVIVEKGIKQVGQITAQKRGTLVTVCCCGNAAGQALPPAMIFPRVNFKDYMLEGDPASTFG